MEAQHSQIPVQNTSAFDQTFNRIWDSFEDIHHDYKIEYTQKSKSTVRSYLNQDYVNYALGAMYGAFMGDALGSFLEFNHNITLQLIKQAMKMPGEGAFPFLKPGQFTDDSQMASHMLTALTTYDPSKQLSSQQQQIIINIAYQYWKWYESNPFDIGITTRVGLAQIDHLFKTHKIGERSPQNISDFYNQLQKKFQTISSKNQNSQSNGSLMRITPMAFFVSTLIKNGQKASEKSFAFYQDFIQNEVNMTHGNKVIYESSKSWVDLLVQMILRQGKSVNDVYKNFERKYKENENYKYVQEWIRDSQKQAMDAVNKMGWAKIAYTHGLRELRELIQKEKSQKNIMSADTFEKVLEKILSLKGDTDTNGAIVGGLIGAVVGFKNLPNTYLKNQFKLRLQLDRDQYGSRGSEYEPRREFLKAISLIQKFESYKHKQVN